MTYDINLIHQISRKEHPDPGQYDHIYDYITSLTTLEYIEEERRTIAKIDEFQKLETWEEMWDYAENELFGNIIDEDYKYYCWLDLKQYTPRLVFNYATEELYLEYVLSSTFIPRFKIEKENLLDLLNEWEKYLRSH